MCKSQVIQYASDVLLACLFSFPLFFYIVAKFGQNLFSALSSNNPSQSQNRWVTGEAKPLRIGKPCGSRVWAPAVGEAKRRRFQPGGMGLWDTRLLSVLQAVLPAPARAARCLQPGGCRLCSCCCCWEMARVCAVTSSSWAGGRMAAVVIHFPYYHLLSVLVRLFT